MWKPKSLINPCDENGTCLVKAGCRLAKNAPWERQKKCPDYKKWMDRSNKVENIQAFTTGSIFICIGLIIIIWIIGTFGLGLWEEYKFIKDFFK